MPDPRQQLQDEIRRTREAFYRRLAADAQAATDRLELAYQQRLVGINQAIRQYELAGKDIPAAIEHLRQRVTAELDQLQGAVVDVTQSLQAGGIEAGVRSGIVALQRGGLDVAFNLQTIDSVKALINYVDNPAWRAAVGGLGEYHGQRAADILLDAFARGINPKQSARWMRTYFAESARPKLDALRLARTTQLYAARSGTWAIYQRNGVDQWIWCANLGNARTCMACIALHGTLHRGVLNDHHFGRCGPMPLTPRWSELGLSGGEVQFESGIAWFNRQSDGAQAELMGPKFYEAYRAGRFDLSQLPRTYTNPIFGEMRRKATLEELLAGRQG